MNNTTLSAKKEQLIFKNESHRKFYEEWLPKCRYQDVYHKALVYCLGINEDTRNHVEEIYDFKSGCVQTECLQQGWNTSGSVSPLVVSIVAADKKLAKNIAVGDIKISRPRRSPAEGNTSIEMKGVEIVSYNVIRYHRKRAADYLKSLEDSLQMQDIAGKSGVKFFIEKWNELVGEYM